jgi:hypothetical protein
MQLVLNNNFRQTYPFGIVVTKRQRSVWHSAEESPENIFSQAISQGLADAAV